MSIKDLFKHPEIIISALGIIVSIFAIVFATKASNAAKKVSESEERIVKDNLAYQIDQTSLDYMSSAYDEIFYRPENYYVYLLIKNNTYVNDNEAFKRVIDIFEGIGSGFCQGTIKKKHIQPYVYRALGYVCKNSQINLDFAKGQIDHKNGVAILCEEFYSDSEFAKQIDMSNVPGCHFFDADKNGSFGSYNDSNLKKYIFPPEL